MTQDELRERFAYDERTGLFTLRKRSEPHSVGCTTQRGYIQICIDGKFYLAHRLAWFYVHGRWPTPGTDHIDRNRSNNAIENLREATQAQNMQNITCRGIRRKGKSWYAAICSSGERECIGSFPTEKAARDAYLKRKAELHTFNPVPR